MSDIATEVLEDLYAYDRTRPRSQQTALGMSQVGVCRRQAQYVLTGTEKRGHNSTGLAAIVGTALHTAIQEARKERAEQEGLLQELEVTLTVSDTVELLGHVDEVDPARNIVRDWKGSTGAKIAEYRETGIPEQYIHQVTLYAAALGSAEVLNPDRPITRQVVFLDRNGKMPPWAWEQEIDLRSQPADLAASIAWVMEVYDGIKQGEDLPQDKPVTFCQDWCPFYWTCREPYLSEATHADLSATSLEDARRYLQLSRREAQVKAAKEEVKGRLVGVQGKADGISVRWTSYDRDSYTVKAGTVNRLDVRGKD